MNNDKLSTNELIGLLITIAVFLLLPTVPDFIDPLFRFAAFVANCIVAATAGLVAVAIIDDLSGN